MDKESEIRIKEGYLTRCNESQVLMRKITTDEYYVLTAASLDSYDNRRREKLKKRYSLVLITNVEPSSSAPNQFNVISSLQKTSLVLLAINKDECDNWVTAISDAAAKWNTNESDFSETISIQDEDDELDQLCLCLVFPTQYVSYQVCSPEFLQVQGESPMIKYARDGNSIPHERVFKIDKERLHILWRKTGHLRKYSLQCSLYIGDIVEARFGQQTRNFNQYPYAEVEKQSFSLMFEKEQGEWCGLNSLDVICDSVLAYQQWKQGMQVLVYGNEDGKKAFRESYLVIDPIIVYLKRYWSIYAEQELLLVDICSNFIWQFQKSVKKRTLKNFIRDISRNQFSEDYLHWDSFFFIFNLLYHRRELYEEFKKIASNEHLGMSQQEFLRFLKETQKVANVDIHTAVKLIKYHDKQNRVYKRILAGDNPKTYQESTNFLSLHGFVSFLRSADNAFTSAVAMQDMTYPLSHYFINSSHNTYLTGHQLKGLSSCEAYVYSLLNGSRCLELDCWDGPDEPIITHGMTLTSKIQLRHVIEIIKAYAFDVSPYPVILSLENHCCSEQQIIMAQLFTSILGDMLVTENFCEDNILPSPEQLKYKIILKGRAQITKKKKTYNKHIKGIYQQFSKHSKRISTSSSSTEGYSQLRSISETSTSSATTRTRSETTAGSPTSDSSTGSPATARLRGETLDSSTDSPTTRLRSETSDSSTGSPTTRLRSETSDSSSSNPEAALRLRLISLTTHDADDEVVMQQFDAPGEGEQEEIPLAALMSSLIVYCKTVPYKPEAISFNCSEMHSFGENLASELSNEKPLDILLLSQKKLLRTYPRGTRVDSSNYNPFIMWQCGIQLVALNMQKPDLPTHINTGFFQKANGTGYILKPAALIKKGSNYHPKMTKSVWSGKVSVQIICGQFVDPQIFTGLPIYVEVQSIGIEASCDSFSTAVSTNTFNPVWSNNEHVFEIIMPSLCVLYFKVFTVGRVNKLVYQNCFPVDMLRAGLRYIPLKTVTGVKRYENGLFMNFDVLLNANRKQSEVPSNSMSCHPNVDFV